MIIKQGEFVSFAPAELQARRSKPLPPRPRKASSPAANSLETGDAFSSRSDLLEAVERLVRANERLTLERDQLREELSRQSLEARRAKRVAAKPKHVDENERQRELPRTRAGRDRVDLSPAPKDDEDDPGFELARVVVNWFWEDADEAAVRLVHDALTGQGIRTLVREADEDGES